MALHDREPQFEDEAAPVAVPEPAPVSTEPEPVEGESDIIVDARTGVAPITEEEVPVEEAAPVEEIAPVEEVPVEEVVVEPTKPENKIESVEGLEAKKARLLTEIQELRRDRREAKGSTFQKHDQPAETPVFIKPEEDVLKDTAPEDVALIEKVLKAKGYVRKDELAASTFQEKLSSVELSWLEQNPEFKQENDPEDEKWNQVRSYVSRLGMRPTKPDDVREILDIARERLFGKKTAPLPEKSLHSVAAKKQNIAVGAKTSSGGSSPAKPVSKSNDISVLKSVLKDFSDEELEELASP